MQKNNLGANMNTALPKTFANSILNLNNEMDTAKSHYATQVSWIFIILYNQPLIFSEPLGLSNKQSGKEK